MIIIRTPEEMLAWSRDQRAAGKSIGLVPTMGYLHQGHRSLIRISAREADVTVVSLFVNPTQFGPNEDLARYPRDEARDEEHCREEGAAVLFIPHDRVMYAPDHSVRVVEESLSRGLCGATRPGHFAGVVTVVAKLFNIVDPDMAVFGEKDAQQLRVIRRLARDLNFPVQILSGPIIRESDGLAMSSRNKLLSDSERVQAVKLRESLEAARKAFESGERSAAVLKETAARVLAGAPDGRVDYIELVDDQTLATLETIEGPALLAVAVHFPSTRLIDNTMIDG